VLGNLFGAIGRSISSPFLKSGDKTPTALTEKAQESDQLTATDQHSRAMLNELKLSNRLHKERLFYIHRDRFVGPTLLTSAAENTLANA